MTRPHYVRNFALVGISAAVLVTLVPSLDGAPAAKPQPFSLATSPKLLNYLEEQLRPASTRKVLGKVDVGGSETAAGSEPSAEVGKITAVASPVPAPAVDEFTLQSSIALNVRAGPRKTTGKLFVLQPETPVRIDGTSGNWARIVTADGATGWVLASYLGTAEGQVGASNTAVGVSQTSIGQIAVAPPVAPSLAIENRTTTKGRAFRIANDTAMRFSPSKGSPKLSIIRSGSKLSVLEWDGSWARVMMADGTSGWINVR